MRDRIIRYDAAHSDDEDRWHVIGRIDGLVYLAVITYRNELERPISLRRASPKERKYYAETTST